MPSPLSDYFSGVAVKRLSDVEVAPGRSNQHEFNGGQDFKTILGTGKQKLVGKFIYLADDEDELIESEGFLSWYDSRKNQPNRTPEYRLYYTSNPVTPIAKSKDLFVFAITNEGEFAVIIAPQNSTSEKQLLWLFGIQEVKAKFIVKNFTTEKKEIGFAGKYILSALGIEQKETNDGFIEGMLSKFGRKFPSTKEFSDYSRSTVRDVSPTESPDETLIAWLEREELLFRTLEGVLVKEQLKKGFGIDGTDVDEFIKLSLSVQNRRKSRAGHSFENNLAILFTLNKIKYSHGAITERNNKPDFVFPGIDEYRKVSFEVELLTMLGVKTSAKDRWRQVLSEASRIENKHLITLEPSISKNQIADMKANKLQLIIPAPLFDTYSDIQQKELMTVKEFMKIVLFKQR